jgi:hypothetical protein
VTNPLRCLGEMLATFVGWALGGAFFLLAKARGRKALHPRGEVLAAAGHLLGPLDGHGAGWVLRTVPSGGSALEPCSESGC